MGGEADQVLWRGVRPVQGISGIWPARNAVRVYASEYLTGALIKTVYEVPADKKLFISSCWLSTRNAAAASYYALLTVYNTVPASIAELISHYYDSIGQQVTALSFFPAIEAAAGFKVRAYSSDANLDVGCSIFGWLEDA